MKPSLLLADDHPIVLDGLTGLLHMEFDLVGMARDGRELVDQAIRLRPDLILTDISMPLLNGIDALARLRAAGVDARVVFLTMHVDATYAGSALRAGASGYVLKHAAAREVVQALFEALRGGIYLSSEIASAVSAVQVDPCEPVSTRLGRLSLRQREVLRLLAEGKSAKEAAAILGISPRTAEFHKYRIMEILNLATTADLVTYAVHHGIR